MRAGGQCECRGGGNRYPLTVNRAVAAQVECAGVHVEDAGGRERDVDRRRARASGALQYPNVIECGYGPPESVRDPDVAGNVERARALVSQRRR